MPYNIISVSYLLKKRLRGEKMGRGYPLLKRNQLYLCVKISHSEKSKKYIYYKQITL
jgi:hypothetical protein